MKLLPFVHLTLFFSLLQLIGHALEEDEKAKTGDGSTPKLDSIMTIINDLGTDASNTSVSKYIKEMMTDLVKLRTNDWGKSSAPLKIPAQYLDGAAAASAAAAQAPQEDLIADPAVPPQAR